MQNPGGVLMIVGLDGSYVFNRHRQEERHCEVIAGKVIDVDGIHAPHRLRPRRPGGLGRSVRAGARC